MYGNLSFYKDEKKQKAKCRQCLSKADLNFKMYM